MMSINVVLNLEFIPAPPIRKKVTPWQLQERFNAGKYWERAMAGAYICQTFPAPRKRQISHTDEPVGSEVMMVDFFEPVNPSTCRFVFRADVVLRPDGSFGGRDAQRGQSARPDPKKLVDNGVTYCFREPTPQELRMHLNRLRSHLRRSS